METSVSQKESLPFKNRFYQEKTPEPEPESAAAFFYRFKESVKTGIDGIFAAMFPTAPEQ